VNESELNNSFGRLPGAFAGETINDRDVEMHSQALSRTLVKKVTLGDPRFIAMPNGVIL
jgi:hypothetical protein